MKLTRKVDGKGAMTEAATQCPKHSVFRQQIKLPVKRQVAAYKVLYMYVHTRRGTPDCEERFLAQQYAQYRELQEGLIESSKAMAIATRLFKLQSYSFSQLVVRQMTI